MGCTATRAVDDVNASSRLPSLRPSEVVDVDQPGLKEMDSSYGTWKWGEGFAKGMPCPPSRRMHERHMQKLENFMQKVEAFPVALPSVVQRRREKESQNELEDSEQSIYKDSIKLVIQSP
eukprot:Skav226932  [mRNA]  locus=scaffold965:95955:96314:- [translate_table: standard]